MSMLRTIFWSLPLILITMGCYAVDYQHALVGPSFDQPGSLATQFRPPPRQVKQESVAPAKQAAKPKTSTSTQVANPTDTPPSEFKAYVPPPSAATSEVAKAKEGAAVETKEEATLKKAKVAKKRKLEKIYFTPKRFYAPYSPGNAQLYFGEGEDFNQERYKKIPKYLRNNPSWQDGHFITKPTEKK